MRILALLGLAACTTGTGDTGTPNPGFSDTSGVIFKGPMSAGSTVTVQPLNETGRPIGEPVTADVDDASGAYSLSIQHEGLVEIVAEGEVMDESRGEVYGPPITLKAIGWVSEGESELHVNVLTDLGHERMKALIAQGMDFETAEHQTRMEFGRAFAIGVAPPPSDRGDSLNPYGDGFAQSYLFAASAVIAQAARDLEDQGLDLGALMADVREDFGEDGEVDAIFVDALNIAETRTDPDLASLGLDALLREAGLDLPRPNLHPALDSDQDGLANDQDNCRYVANADQTDGEGRGFGDACDYRMTAIVTTDQWGCGILADGTPTWWQVDAPPSGGSPPRPDVFPNAPFAPWGTASNPLPDSYSHVAIGDGLVCGLSASDSTITCWTSGGPALSFPGTFRDIAIAPELACALSNSGALYCLGPDGPLSLPGPYADFAMIGDDGLCTVSDLDGSIDCQHADGAIIGGIPTGAMVSVEGSRGGQAWACAIDTGGYLHCFGDSPLNSIAPTDGGYTEVAVGSGVACAAKADGTLSCWRDEEECPGGGEIPASATNLSANGCTVCGIDEAGLGVCWPRYWDLQHPQ